MRSCGRLLCRRLASGARGGSTAAVAYRAAPSLPSSPSSPSPSSSSLCTPQRNFSFRLPFFAGAFSFFTAAAPAAVDPVRQQHEAAVSKAHQNASLQNERLLDACLEILELCGGSATGEKSRLELDTASKDWLWELADVLLHDFRRPPWEQYDLVYMSLCLPVAQEDPQVYRSLMIILESIVPEPLYRLYEASNLFITGDDEESLTRRQVLHQFAHALLGDLHAPTGVEDEELLLVFVDDFKTYFPTVVTTPAFATLQSDVAGIAMRAKLFSLLGKLCVEFDHDRAGKVLLSELKSTAVRVLGDEQAAMLLAGAPVDGEGKIAYAQMAALLTRPPPKRAADAKDGA